LDPNIRKGRWNVDEDELLFEAKKKYGCCWVRVATMIPTRTQRQCRTRWNQLESRKLSLENRFGKLFTENTSNPSSEMYSQRAMKLPEPIQTYFPSLEIDELLSQPQSLLVSPDYSSSAYSFDDAFESLNIEMPLPVSYQPNYFCRNPSLDNIHYNFTPQALDTENNLHIV
jgi:hypothetical protein